MTKTEPIRSEPVATDEPSIVRRVAAGDGAVWVGVQEEPLN